MRSLPAGSAAVGSVALLVGWFACTNVEPEPTPPDPAAVEDEVVATAPACRDRRAEEPLAVADDTGSCSASLSLGESQGLVFEDTDVDADPPRATGPDPCASGSHRCEYSLHRSAAGPLGLVVAFGPASEVAVGVWLLAPAGPELTAVPLWAGASVRSDGTEVGPMYRLAPRVCGDALALVVEGRLGGAATQPPPAELSERQGAWAVVDGGWTRTGPVPSECRRVALPVP